MSKIYLLNSMKYEGVENLEVFGIKYIDVSIEISKYDALIFTSKNAINSLEFYNIDWKKIPSYVIAPKTAKLVENCGGKVEFIGKYSHGNEFANELIPLLKNKKVLYIKAKKTVSELSNILKNNGIDLDDVIAYETSCQKVITNIEKKSIIIFTSPSSVECFFKNFDWDESFKAVVIGKTTAKYLPTQVKYTVSSITSIDECLKIAQEL